MFPVQIVDLLLGILCKFRLGIALIATLVVQALPDPKQCSSDEDRSPNCSVDAVSDRIIRGVEGKAAKQRQQKSGSNLKSLAKPMC